MEPTVISVHRSGGHTFGKPVCEAIELIEGIGVDGDAHAGVTVKHRSRVAKNPSTPNLRQVHLIHRELFDLVERAGYRVAPGELGENITTGGLDLLGLPVGTRLRIGATVLVITGLRNPCEQINRFQPGLLKQVLRRNGEGEVERLAGVMSIVARGGTVRAGDPIIVERPADPHFPLTPV
ncbi:MOSC domain-containing protein [Microlunatus sp. GCM10028923]|uniref:MOSC domain-containing protein n=1 Tax=Microlunatus sp. GCM10028923 TaxID=3273400 RepID=UPI003612B77D